MSTIKTAAVQDAQQSEVARTLLQIWQTLHPDRPSSKLSHFNICGAMEALYDDGEAEAWQKYLPIVSKVAAEVGQ